MALQALIDGLANAQGGFESVCHISSASRFQGRLHIEIIELEVCSHRAGDEIRIELDIGTRV